MAFLSTQLARLLQRIFELAMGDLRAGSFLFLTRNGAMMGHQQEREAWLERSLAGEEVTGERAEVLQRMTGSP